jgi:acetyl-CoA acetyltransferase
MVAQACATSVAAVSAAAQGVEAGDDGLTLAVLTDRTSNGPHLVYPNPSAQGGTAYSEDWVMENFRRDPWAGESMVQTAEHVAEEGGFDRQAVDEVTLLRHRQYEAALADDRAFQRRYMVPVELPGRRGTTEVVEADTGIRPAEPDAIARLDPALPGGVVTFAAQTHPADGAAGVLVTSEERARAIGNGEGGVTRLLASGVARVAKGRMPKAPVPAARAALADAGIGARDLDAVCTHNPFAVNDLWLARETGIPVEDANRYGSSLATATRRPRPARGRWPS